jgi:hypothetical protein
MSVSRYGRETDTKSEVWEHTIVIYWLVIRYLATSANTFFFLVSA